ncbi:MAG: hypothetical protein OXE92_04610 [Bacteroidetes bacterium]|nr:hypothetical protein [Bacteroidota bacterium]
MRKRLQFCILLEQDTVGLVLRKNGRHPVLMIEFDLDRSPAAVDLMIPKFTPNQMRGMKGENAQKQIRLNPQFLAVVNRGRPRSDLMYRLENREVSRIIEII